jgi:hypothetical protein
VLQGVSIVQGFRTYSASRGWRLRPGAAGWQSGKGHAIFSNSLDAAGVVYSSYPRDTIEGIGTQLAPVSQGAQGMTPH